MEGEHGDTVYIDDVGICCLAMGSHLPTARPFKEWVTEAVLPAFEQQGLFSLVDDASGESSSLLNDASGAAPRAASTFPSLPPCISIDLGPAPFLDATQKHLYAVSTPRDFAAGLLKVGVAKDVLARRNQLQTGQSDTLVVLAIVTNGGKLEPLVLRFLPASDAGGTEWRKCSLDEFKEATQKAYKIMLDSPPTSAVQGQKRKREENMTEFELTKEKDKHRLDVLERESAIQSQNKKTELEAKEKELELQERAAKLESQKKREELEFRRQGLEIRRLELQVEKEARET
jgi:hypothetical protein